MQLSIRTRHLELTSETSEEIRRRVNHAFAQISPWIPAIDVTTVDIDGPEGGADTQCCLVPPPSRSSRAGRRREREYPVTA